MGQRAAAQAGAAPGGAQSPALTQLKAGAAAPPFRRRLRQHSPADVIMAAPCTRSPARSPCRLRSVSVSSGPARCAAPPHCPRAQLSHSLAQAAGSLLAQDPARPGAAHRPACRPARALRGPAFSAPPLLPRLSRNRCTENSIVFSNHPRGQSSHGVGTLVCIWNQASKWPPPKRGPPASPAIAESVERRCERCAQRHLLRGRSRCSAHSAKPLRGEDGAKSVF